MTSAHIEPTAAQMERLLAAAMTGPVTMLNLLRYAPEADYSAHPDLAPDTPITGRDAYGRYSEGVLPILADLGGEVVLFGPCHPGVIGPEDEIWDDLALIRYPDLDAFVTMVGSEEYLAIMGHRTAALADSRLVPTAAAAP